MKKQRKYKLHRGYSSVKPLRVRRELSVVRQGLIKDLGGVEAELSMGQILLLNGVISTLGIVRCMEDYAREAGVFQGKQLTVCLQRNYTTYRETLRRYLIALFGIERKKSANKAILITKEYLKQFDGSE